MMRFLLPLVLLVAAIVIFAGPTRGTYNKSGPLSERKETLEAALKNAREIQAVRKDLQQKYNNFSDRDINALKKMLPEHVDNVRLIIDIDNVARRRGMVLKNVSLSASSEDVAATVQTQSRGGADGAGNVEHIDLKLTVTSRYDDFRLFLDDLARSLRIVDVSRLGFTSGDASSFDFDMNIRTYWLRDKG